MRPSASDRVISEVGHRGSETQMAAPSNDVRPATLTVRFVLTRFGPCPETHGGNPAGTAGTMKLIWYRPGYPGVKPANNGIGVKSISGIPCEKGEEGKASAWKLKASLNVSAVGAGCVAG